MGISSDRAFQIQEKLLARVNDIYDSARHLYSTHGDMADRLHAEVWGSPDLAKCPVRVRAYLRGYARALAQGVYRDLAWLLSCDGRLMTSKEVDALTITEANSCLLFGAPDYRSPWSRIDGDLSRHVWIGRDGCPLRDKPYDRKFRAAEGGQS